MTLLPEMAIVSLVGAVAVLMFVAVAAQLRSFSTPITVDSSLDEYAPGVGKYAIPHSLHPRHDAFDLALARDLAQRRDGDIQRGIDMALENVRDIPAAQPREFERTLPRAA